jgi:hypothetical protein
MIFDPEAAKAGVLSTHAQLVECHKSHRKHCPSSILSRIATNASSSHHDVHHALEIYKTLPTFQINWAIAGTPPPPCPLPCSLHLIRHIMLKLFTRPRT